MRSRHRAGNAAIRRGYPGRSIKRYQCKENNDERERQDGNPRTRRNTRREHHRAKQGWKETSEVAAAPDRGRLRGDSGRGRHHRLERLQRREARRGQGGVRHRRRHRAQQCQRIQRAAQRRCRRCRRRQGRTGQGLEDRRIPGQGAQGHGTRIRGLRGRKRARTGCRHREAHRTGRLVRDPREEPNEGGEGRHRIQGREEAG